MNDTGDKIVVKVFQVARKQGAWNILYGNQTEFLIIIRKYAGFSGQVSSIELRPKSWTQKIHYEE